MNLHVHVDLAEFLDGAEHFTEKSMFHMVGDALRLDTIILDVTLLRQEVKSYRVLILPEKDALKNNRQFKQW